MEINEIDNKLKEENEIFNFTYEVWEKTYLKIHFLPMTTEKFYHAKTPLLYWVRKEGKEI